MNSRLTLFVAVALVAGAAGFLAGRNAAHRNTSVDAAAAQTINQAEARPGTAARRNKNENAGERTAPARPAFDAADLEAQLKKAASGSWRKRWERIQDLAKSLSPADATNALALAEKVLGQNEFWTFRYQVFEKWADADPQALLAYGQSLKSRNDRQQAISSALTEWAHTDADAAMAWVDKLPRGQERRDFLSSVLQGLAENDPKRALEKINSLPMYQRQYVRGQVIEAMAEKDPKAAATMALENDRSSRYGGWGEGQLGNVLQKWMRNDADGALAWLQSQPEAVRKRAVVLQAAQNLGWQDPAAGMKLIEILPKSQQRDDTLGHILN